MKVHEERVLESFRRVQGWFAVNPQYAAGNRSLSRQLETLHGIVSRLTDHGTSQETQRVQSLLVSTDEAEKRREVLSHQMTPIATVARALRGTVPGIGVLSRPRGNVSTPQLIAAAAAMGEKAELYKDVLIENGLPADFIDQLQTATATLRASIDGRGLARASRAAATQGVKTEVRLGRRIVAIIGVIITRQVRSDPATLAEWEHLKRVTVKGVAVRRSVGHVQTSSTPAPLSSTRVEMSSTDIVATSTVGAKAA